jgi:hypothetical protein
MVMATLPGRIEENAEGTLASKAAETFGKEE